MKRLDEIDTKNILNELWNDIKENIDLLDFLFSDSEYMLVNDYSFDWLAEYLSIIDDNRQSDTYYQRSSDTLKTAVNAIIDYMEDNIELYIPYDPFSCYDMIVFDRSTNRKYIIENKHRKEEFDSFILEVPKYEALKEIKRKENAFDILYLNTYEGGYKVFSLNMINNILKKGYIVLNYKKNEIVKTITVLDLTNMEYNKVYRGREVENFKYNLLVCQYYTKKYTDFGSGEYTTVESMFIPKQLCLNNIIRG